jgi:hypothetical protein
VKNFIKHFRRREDGGWECMSSADLTAPNGRIQVTQGSIFMPGTIFMGIDLAKLLDEEDKRRSSRSLRDEGAVK